MKKDSELVPEGLKELTCKVRIIEDGRVFRKSFAGTFTGVKNGRIKRQKLSVAVVAGKVL